MSSRKMEKLAQEINSLRNQVNGMNSPQLAYSSIEDGAITEYDEDGNLVSVIGKQYDGTHGVNPVNGPIPPQTTDPIVFGGPGVIRVKWDGQFTNGNMIPLDFSRVEIHIGDTPGFAFDPLPNSDTRAGSIESGGGGEAAIIRPAGTYYIKLLTRSTSGRFAEPSTEVIGVAEAIVTQEELQEIFTELEVANTNLADLQVTLGTVQTDLQDAADTLATVDQIDGRLNVLEVDYSTLSEDVASAAASATNAVSKADAASSVAGAAQAAADSAATAAGNAAAEAGAATQAAQMAQADALEAANLVANKSTVYWGLPEPAGDEHGLWINDGKPYLWDGTSWVESTNAELVQAAADAAQAKTDAANAVAVATQAATDAAQAVVRADEAASDAAQAQTAAQTALSAAQSAETAANAAAVDADDALAASNAASVAAGAAQLAADNAETAASNAEAAAGQAELDAYNALETANDALAAGQAAETSAAQANTAANDALAEAAEAADAAGAAVGTANAATVAAQDAQDAAEAANTQALAAAGLAGSKGEVIYQASAPTGSRANSANLWIRTSDSKPHVYNGTSWVAVTDKAATDAAVAAAGAQSTANSAMNVANAANGTVNLWKHPNSTLIDGGKLYTDSVTANQIAAGAITADEIAANAVTTAKINAGAITAGTIASGAIISEKIGANAVTAGKINADVITSREISAGAVKAAQIDAGAVVAGKIAAGAITAGTIAANAVAAGTIAADAITGREINALAVNTEHLASGAVVAEKIAARAISADKLVISNTNNMIPNGALEYGDLTGWNPELSLSTDTPTNHKYSVECVAGQTSLITPGAWFEVDPNQKYLFEVWLKADKPNSNIYLEFRDEDANHAFSSVALDAEPHAGNSSYPVSNLTVPTAWTRYRGVLTPRTKLTKASMSRVYWNHPNGTETGAVQSIAGMRMVALTPSVRIENGAVTADKIAANSIVGSKIVGLTITGDKIAANSISADKIIANAITSDKIVANAIITDKIAANAVTADKIRANAIIAEHIQAGAIDVGHLKTGTLSADNLEAGYINAEIGIGTTGALVVGDNTSRYVELANGKIQTYVQGELGPIPATSMGGTEDAFRVFSPDGTMLGGINSDGSMVTTIMDADELRISGTDFVDMLDEQPKGVIVWTGTQSEKVGPYTDKTGVWEFGFDAIGGRRYRIDLTAELDSNTNTSPLVEHGMTKRHSVLGGDPGAARISDSPIPPGRVFFTSDGNGRHTSYTWWFQPSNDETTRWLWWIAPFSGSAAEASNFFISVTDMGRNPENKGRASLGGASGTTPPPEPITRDYTKEYSFVDHQVWSQYGKGDGGYRDHWIRQGTMSGVNGVYRTYLALPTEVLNIAGNSSNNITKVQIRLTRTNDGFDTNPITGIIRTTNITTSEPAIYDPATAGQTWKVGETRWFTLNTDQLNEIRANQGKGIVIGRKSSATLVNFYGPTASLSKRPKIRVFYEGKA